MRSKAPPRPEGAIPLRFPPASIAICPTRPPSGKERKRSRSERGRGRSPSTPGAGNRSQQREVSPKLHPRGREQIPEDQEGAFEFHGHAPEDGIVGSLRVGGQENVHQAKPQQAPDMRAEVQEGAQPILQTQGHPRFAGKHRAKLDEGEHDDAGDGDGKRQTRPPSHHHAQAASEVGAQEGRGQGIPGKDEEDQDREGPIHGGAKEWTMEEGHSGAQAGVDEMEEQDRQRRPPPDPVDFVHPSKPGNLVATGGNVFRASLHATPSIGTFAGSSTMQRGRPWGRIGTETDSTGTVATGNSARF